MEEYHRYFIPLVLDGNGLMNPHQRDEHHGLFFYSPRAMIRPTNKLIQVGTHADSQISEAVVKGVRGFDLEVAWQAVVKDATVPPVNDNTTM